MLPPSWPARAGHPRHCRDQHRKAWMVGLPTITRRGRCPGSGGSVISARALTCITMALTDLQIVPDAEFPQHSPGRHTAIRAWVIATPTGRQPATATALALYFFSPIGGTSPVIPA